MNEIDEIELMNTPIQENYYPIHEACKTNNIIALKHMLPHVNLNIRSPIGTPLIIACKYNYSEMIDLLIQHVDLTITDTKGNNFLHYLSRYPDLKNRFPHFSRFMIQKNEKDTCPLDLLTPDRITIDIIKSLPPIYFFSGHGCDTGEEKIVPDDCLYVSLVLCGDFNRISSTELFLKMSGVLLEDPIKHKHEIEKHLKMPIQIYKLGDIYSDSICIPVFDIVDVNKIITSGLQSVYLRNRIVLVKDDDPNLKQKLYQHSLYPRLKNVPDISSKEEIQKWKDLRVLQSSLIGKFKGIHYNLSCRSPCNEPSISRVKLRREKSITRRIAEGNIKTLEQLKAITPETIDLLYEWIEDPGILFQFPKEVLREFDIPKDKESLLVPSKFVDGHRITLEQLKAITPETIDILYDWIEDRGTLFQFTKEALREFDIPKDKEAFLVPSKFIGGKRKSRKIKRKSRKIFSLKRRKSLK